ncbi:MAG: hypothetical protein IKG32_09080 [Clostridia bacterium]|nr:hypothetical protein [Clostridia bacterium]
MINWTLEEESILNIYNHGSRLSTLSAIEEVLPYLGDEPDMRLIVKSTIEKLEQTSDMDFMLMMMESDPLWEDEEEYEEAMI